MKGRGSRGRKGKGRVEWVERVRRVDGGGWGKMGGWIIGYTEGHGGNGGKKMELLHGDFFGSAGIKQ
jgi:hypothetical protein